MDKAANGKKTHDEFGRDGGSQGARELVRLLADAGVACAHRAEGVSQALLASVSAATAAAAAAVVTGGTPSRAAVVSARDREEAWALVLCRRARAAVGVGVGARAGRVGDGHGRLGLAVEAGHVRRIDVVGELFHHAGGDGLEVLSSIVGRYRLSGLTRGI